MAKNRHPKNAATNSQQKKPAAQTAPTNNASEQTDVSTGAAQTQSTKAKKQAPSEAEIIAQAKKIYKQIFELSEKIKEVSPQNPKQTIISEEEIVDIKEKIGDILKNLENFSKNFLQEKPNDRAKINSYINNLNETQTNIDLTLDNKAINERIGGYLTSFNDRKFSNNIRNIKTLLENGILKGEFENMQNDFKAEVEKKREEQERRQKEEEERQYNEQLQKSVNKAVKQRNNVAKEMRKQIKQEQEQEKQSEQQAPTEAKVEEQPVQPITGAAPAQPTPVDAGNAAQPEPQPVPSAAHGISKDDEQVKMHSDAFGKYVEMHSNDLEFYTKPTTKLDLEKERERREQESKEQQQSEQPADAPKTAPDVAEAPSAEAAQPAPVDTHAGDVMQKKEQTEEEKRQKEEEEKKEQERRKRGEELGEVINNLLKEAPTSQSAQTVNTNSVQTVSQEKIQELPKMNSADDVENFFATTVESNSSSIPQPQEQSSIDEFFEETQVKKAEQGEINPEKTSYKDEDLLKMLDNNVPKQSEPQPAKPEQQPEQPTTGAPQQELKEQVVNTAKLTEKQRKQEIEAHQGDMEAAAFDEREEENNRMIEEKRKERERREQELKEQQQAQQAAQNTTGTNQPRQVVVEQQPEQILSLNTAYKNYENAANEYQTASDDFDEMISSNNFTNIGRDREKLLETVNKQYNHEDNGNILSYDDLIESLGSQIDKIIKEKLKHDCLETIRDKMQGQNKIKEVIIEKKVNKVGCDVSIGRILDEDGDDLIIRVNMDEEIENAEKGLNSLKAAKEVEQVNTAKERLDALKAIKELKEKSDKVIEIRDAAEKFYKAFNNENEARKTAKDVEKVYVEELVSRLKNNQWSKMIVKSDNGTETSLSKDINALSPDHQKHLLTRALKIIYNSDDENGKNLQQKLGLDNSFSEEEKNGIINLLIEKTIEQNFDNKYQKELFAEEEPKKEDKTINIASIIEDIKTVYDSIKQQAQQQTTQPAQQEQTINGFEEALINRENEIHDLIEKKGVKEFRKEYRTNSIENHAKHELDAIVLKNFKKNDNELYKKIAPKMLIHGVYKQIKNDQEKFDKINKLTKDRGILNREIKPKKIKADKIGDIINEFPNTEEAQKALKFLCKQQFKNENCSKEKNKWPDNMLNAVLEHMRPDAFQNIEILKNAINEENMASTDKPLSFAKPTEDDTLYFKIVYSHSSKEVMNELKQDLAKKENSYFRQQFNRLSLEKQEDLINFIKIAGEEKERITGDERGVNNEILGTLISLNKKKIAEKEQEEQSPKGPLSEDEKNKSAENILSGNEEIVLGVEEVEGDPKSKASNPYFLVNEKGRLYKNEENILDKQTFSLQDSFLGLVCAKNKAFALTNWGKSINMLDGKDGKKLDKDERFTPEQIKEQQEATKAAKEAIQRAGGDLKTVQKHTMPLLKDKEFVFYRRVKKGNSTQLKPLLLSDAVEICLKALELKRKKEQALGIVKNNLKKEKSLVDQVCDMLKITDDSKGQFTPKQLEEIKKAVSMQLIATNTFVEKFQEQNKALAEKLKKEQEQEMAAKLEREKEEREEAAAAAQKQTQIDGQPIEVANGLSQKTQEQPQQAATVSIDKRIVLEEQKQQKQVKEEALTRAATPVSEQKSEQLQPDGTPAPGVSTEQSAEQQQPKITVDMDTKIFDKQKQQKGQKEESKKQPEGTSLNNGPEVDSRSSTPTSKESSTELGAKSQPNIQKDSKQSSKGEIIDSLKKTIKAKEELEESSQKPKEFDPRTLPDIETKTISFGPTK